MKRAKKLLLGLVIALAMSLIPMSVMAATISEKSATISVGKRFTLKVSGTSRTPRWSSSKPSVASVTQSGVVTGRKRGTATIYARVGSQTLKCKVGVKKASNQIWVVDNSNFGSASLWAGRSVVNTYRGASLKTNLYRVYYNTSGSLVVEMAYYNSSAYYYYYLSNVKMTLRSTSTGKVVAAQTFAKPSSGAYLRPHSWSIYQFVFTTGTKSHINLNAGKNSTLSYALSFYR